MEKDKKEIDMAEKIKKGIRKFIKENYYSEEMFSRHRSFVSERNSWVERHNEALDIVAKSEESIKYLSSIIEGQPTNTDGPVEEQFNQVLVIDCIKKIKYHRDKIQEQFKFLHQSQEKITYLDKLIHMHKTGEDNNLFDEWELLKIIGDTTDPYVDWKAKKVRESKGK